MGPPVLVAQTFERAAVLRSGCPGVV